MIAALTACGKAGSAEQAADAVQEVAEAAAEEEGMPNPEEEIKAVQATLTFMGGLKTKDDAAKSIQTAIFRNDQGDVIYIYAEDGTVHDYGMYTTEDAKTADGREYAKVVGGMGTYGYYFNEDLTSGIIVDQDENVYDAVELTEDDARAYVAQTLGG
jgi:hypothetical protein